MSDVTLNGNAVIRGDLKLPYSGAFTAELDLNADAAPAGLVSLQFLGRTFLGTVVADPTDGSLALSGDSGGYYRCRVVGGAGGLQKPIEPQEWPQGAVVSQILSAILSAGGESQAADINPSLLAQVLPQWSVPSGTAGGALAALVEYLAVGQPGLVWRIRGDGLVWLGVPAPQQVSPPDYLVSDIAPESGQASWDLNTTSVDVDQVIDGLPLRQVVYTWEPDRLRAVVTFAPGPANALYSLFGQWMKRVGLDFFRNVPGRINSQSGVTVEFQADDSRYAPMRRVGVRLGLPDTSVNIVSGARAEVAWEGASPTGPVLQSFGDSKATKIKVGASAAAGTKPLVNKAQRDAEQVLDGFVKAAWTAISTAPPATTFPTAISLLTLIQAQATILATKYGDYEGAASSFLTTILEGG